MARTHRIAVIAGDGIGTEVMPEGLLVLDAAARKFGIGLQFFHRGSAPRVWGTSLTACKRHIYRRFSPTSVGNV